jgi:hypothetical protein
MFALRSASSGAFDDATPPVYPSADTAAIKALM